MAAAEYQALACRLLGLKNEASNSSELLHQLGHFRISSSLEALKAATNGRLERVLYTLNKSKPKLLAFPDYTHYEYANTVWGRSSAPYMFLSYGDYEKGVRQHGKIDLQSRLDAKLHYWAAIIFTRRFRPDRHTSGRRGYATYLRDCATRVSELVEREFPATIGETDRLTHTYVVGTTSSGKSELLKLLMHGYARDPSAPGLVVIDPVGELAPQIAHWPEFTSGDRLIYIDPRLSPDHLPVLNPFETHGLSDDDKSLTAQEIMYALAEILRGDVAATFSLNMKALLLPCIRTLLEVPHASV